jgi:hypothetical protein
MTPAPTSPLAQPQPRRVGALGVGELDDVEDHDGPVDRLGGHGVITRPVESVAGRPVG